jgi:hypothetical protein
MASTVLVLAVALGTLAGIRASLFLFIQQRGVFWLMGSGLLLLVTLANVAPVFLVALSWLRSFRSQKPIAKEDANDRNDYGLAAPSCRQR